jgi:hypothetical protein
MNRKEIIVYPKSSFYIKRYGYAAIYSEIPTDEPSGHFCYFTKDLPYKATMSHNEHLVYNYVISDYTRFMTFQFYLLSVFNDNFLKEDEWIKIQRDKKLEKLVYDL